MQKYKHLKECNNGEKILRHINDRIVFSPNPHFKLKTQINTPQTMIVRHSQHRLAQVSIGQHRLAQVFAELRDFQIEIVLAFVFGTFIGNINFAFSLLVEMAMMMMMLMIMTAMAMTMINTIAANDMETLVCICNVVHIHR